MAILNSVLRAATLMGPEMFRDQLNLMPAKFTKSGIMSLHDQVYSVVHTRLLENGGSELRPIEAHVCNRNEFAAAMTKCVSIPANPVDIERTQALTYFSYPNGTLKIDLYYNFDEMKARRDPKYLAGTPLGDTRLAWSAGSVMVHEMCGTLYAKQMEYLGRTIDEMLGSGRSINTDFLHRLMREMGIISDGWGAYFSQRPCSVEVLNGAEALFLSRDEKAAASAMPVITNVHTFPALAFTKYEMAFGLERLMELTHEPPGFNSGKLLTPLWYNYDEANCHLMMDAVPLDVFQLDRWILGV